MTLSAVQLENTSLTSLNVSDILLTSQKVRCYLQYSTAKEHLIDLSEVSDILPISLKVRCHQGDPKCSTAGGYLGDPMNFKTILLTALKVTCDPKCGTAGGRLIDLPEGQGHSLDFTEGQLPPRRPVEVQLEDT